MFAFCFASDAGLIDEVAYRDKAYSLITGPLPITLFPWLSYSLAMFMCIDLIL
jgi:hypothetical protein